MKARTLGIVGLSAVAAAACGAPAAEPPTPMTGAGRCPLPLVRGAGDAVVPVRLRLVNRTPVRLSVYLDACLGHIRSGEVASGATGLFGLPRVLYPYRGGLRIHAYTAFPSERYESYIVPLQSTAILTFVVTPETPSLSLGAVLPAAPEPRRELGPGARPVQVHSVGGVSYATAWSDQGQSTMSWMCVNGALRVQVAGPDLARLLGPVSVRLAGQGESLSQDWTLEGGLAPSLSAPGAVARALGEAGVRPEGLRLEATGAAGETFGAFYRPRDLAAALDELSCY